MTRSFRLSVAELAFAMAQSGNAEAAFGYLQTMLPDITPERFGDWMTAASHALIARDLLQAHPDGGYGELNADLHQAAQAIIRDLRTLRCHRLSQSPDGAVDQFVSLLFDEDLILAHWIEQRVVAMIESIPTLGDAYSHVAAFIGAQTDNPLAAQSQDAQHVSVSELGKLRQAASESDPKQMARWLSQRMTADWLDQLAMTLTSPGAIWGDVLRIERINEEVTAERGFLFVSSADAAWLLGFQDPGSSYLIVMPATQHLISEWCDKLLA